MIDEYFEMFSKEQVRDLVDDFGFGIINFGIPDDHSILICFNDEYMYKFLIANN